MNISNVIGWKFNHQPGMACKTIDGVVTVVEFPGGIPTQAEQDAWTAEYLAYKGSVAEKDDDLQAFLDSTAGKVMKSLFLVGVDKGLWTLADVRAKYRGLP